MFLGMDSDFYLETTFTDLEYLKIHIHDITEEPKRLRSKKDGQKYLQNQSNYSHTNKP